MKAGEPGSRRTRSISSSISWALGRRSGSTISRSKVTHQEPQRARAANRRPGQVPDALKVFPSQPQYCRRSRVHARDPGAQVPGRSSVQPSPSQIPEAHSGPARHAAPVGLPDGWAGAAPLPCASAPPGGGLGCSGGSSCTAPGSLVSGGVSVGVGGRGGAPDGEEQPAAASATASETSTSGGSDILKAMVTAYTPPGEQQPRRALS